MKLYITAMFAFVLSMSSIAQIQFKTGDSGLDAELNTANKEANADLPAFKSKLSVDFGLGIPKINEMLEFMNPAEILLSARMKEILGIEIDVVIGSYKTNKEKGWGAIAKDLGIKPGSPEFHALKGKSKQNKMHKGNSNGKGNSKGKGKNK